MRLPRGWWKGLTPAIPQLVEEEAARDGRTLQKVEEIRITETNPHPGGRGRLTPIRPQMTRITKRGRPTGEVVGGRQEMVGDPPMILETMKMRSQRRAKTPPARRPKKSRRAVGTDAEDAAVKETVMNAGADHAV